MRWPPLYKPGSFWSLLAIPCDHIFSSVPNLLCYFLFFLLSNCMCVYGLWFHKLLLITIITIIINHR